nr:hypothetical protein [Pedobacter panaciterrae]
MKTLKFYITILLLLVVAVSCKKNNEVAPEAEEAKIDLTKYMITMDLPNSIPNNRNYNVSYVIVFNNDAKITEYSFSSPAPQSYPYRIEEDLLIISYGGGVGDIVLSISDRNITAVSGFTKDAKNLKLREIPASNQFVGNYSGMLTSYMVNTAFPFAFVFNQTQFGEEMVGDPTLDYALNPVNNVFAYSVIGNIKRYFLIIDDKLVVSRLKSGGTNAESWLFATLNKNQ